jgi:L-amino acid N-acyltransferase YncA
MTATIRPALLEDASAIAAIYQPFVEHTTISFEETPPDAGEFSVRIASGANEYPWLVACEGDRVLGYAYAGRHRERTGYRYSVDVSIYLAVDARGQGIGTLLYSRLFDVLRERGFHRAFAGIALPNDASIALHRRFGFHEVGVYHEVGFKFGRWVDVLWCEKRV